MNADAPSDIAVTRNAGELTPVRTDAPPALLRRHNSPVSDPLGGAPDAAPDTPQARVSMRALLRHKWLALSVFLMLGIPGAVGAFVLCTPQFEAVATVELSPTIPRLVYRTDENGTIPFYQQYLNTQVSVIGSPQVLQRVLDDSAVRATAWFRNPPSPLLGEIDPPLDRLRALLSVAPREGSFVVEVKATTPAPHDSELLANAVVEQYVAYTRQNMAKDVESLQTKLDEEFLQSRASTEGIESTIAELQNSLGRANPEQYVTHLSERLDALTGEAATLRREIELASWRLERLDLSAKLKPDQSPVADRSEATAEARESDWKYAADAEWREAYVKLENAQLQVKVESTRLGDAHPTMIELRQNAALAEKLLRTREATLERTRATAAAEPGGAERAPALERTALMNGLEELRFRLKLVEGETTEQRSELERTNRIVRLLAKENDELRHRRERFEAVRTQKSERETERHVPGSIAIQSRAVAPSSPSNTRRRAMLVGLMLAGGAFAGLGAAYVRAATSRALLDAADVTQPARTAFLGHIPSVGDPERPTLDEERRLGEHVRMVRTAMLERMSARRGQVVLLSSAGPQVGKTTLAFQLGRSFAQCGLRVLLVDADLRNCTLSRRSGADGRRGLIDLLAYGSAESEVIVGTDQPGLQILPAGRLPDRARVEVLADPAFGERLRAWRERYNVILLDSPPVLPVADAAILARVADGTVMVAREGHCRRPDVLEAIARLSTCGARLMGLVYIGSPQTRLVHYTTADSGQPIDRESNAVDVREGMEA